jgi:hypothetical protein
MSAEADYLFTGARHDLVSQNINLSYNSATGVNYPFTEVGRLPYPGFGVVLMNRTETRSDSHALQMAFTKRLSQRWQASGTYLLSGLWDADPLPPSVTFPVAPDLGGEWTLATTDQRHRAVFNGIWQLPYGFQLSGLYFFGSGFALQHHLRRRPAPNRPDGRSWALAPGWHYCAAQRLCRKCHPPCGPAGPAASSPRRSRGCGWDP